MEFPIISFIIFLPILFGFLFIGLGNKYSTIVKYISLLISIVIFLITFLLYFNMLTEQLGGTYSFVDGPIPFIPNLSRNAKSCSTKSENFTCASSLTFISFFFSKFSL